MRWQNTGRWPGRGRRPLVWGVAWLLPWVVSCGGEAARPPATPPVEVAPPGPWLRESGGLRDWGHDGQPFESAHFVVYSDGSSLEAKRQLAAMAEEVLAELIETFGFASPSEVGLLGGHRFWIYANMRHQGVRGEGFPSGVIVPALDSTLDPYHQTDPGGYRAELKHEIVHTFQFILTGCRGGRACPEWLEVWFLEGLPVSLQGEAHWLSPITTLEEYQQWRAQPGHVNPISIRQVEDYPSGHHFTDYYPMFGLAVAYLLDTEAGHGSTITDVLVLFDLMSERVGFREAFEEAMGLGVEAFEVGFYDLMEAYLSQRAPGASLPGAEARRPSERRPRDRAVPLPAQDLPPTGCLPILRPDAGGYRERRP